MYRRSEDELLSWLVASRRKPLVVRGARQVGKSTLVRNVAARRGVPLWEVNLEQHPVLDSVFATLDPATILREIGLRLNRSGVGRGEGVLFLDEVQAAPKAMTALRYFYEMRPDLAVIAAGSLLELTLADVETAMPVGRVDYHFLGPMKFSEFMAARGEDLLLAELSGFDGRSAFSATAHERLLDLLREYLLVGGMPEAVARYMDSRDPVAAVAVHRSILNTYVDDFSKYARASDLERLRRVFEALPANLGQKVRYNRFHPDWRAADIRRALELLQRAGIAVPAVHSDGSGVPIGAEEDPTVFKLFHLDVGLVGTATGLGNVSFEDFRSGRFVNQGVLAEQFVAQHLAHGQPAGEKPRLHYWQRGGSRANAEVDFLVQRGRRVLPVEVKSGASGSLRSLHQFMLKHEGEVAVRLDINPPSRQSIEIDVMTGTGLRTARYTLVNLPLYMAERIRDLA
jgi:hypothetical protein